MLNYMPKRRRRRQQQQTYIGLKATFTIGL